MFRVDTRGIEVDKNISIHTNKNIEFVKFYEMQTKAIHELNYNQISENRFEIELIGKYGYLIAKVGNVGVVRKTVGILNSFVIYAKKRVKYKEHDINLNLLNETEATEIFPNFYLIQYSSSAYLVSFLNKKVMVKDRELFQFGVDLKDVVIPQMSLETINFDNLEIPTVSIPQITIDYPNIRR